MQIEELKEYRYKTELHAHTLPVSACSRIYAEEMIMRYKAIGAHSILLTNHFTPFFISSRTKEEAVNAHVQDYLALKKCAEENGMHAIFGAEIRFTENINDYLVYGIDEKDLSEIYDYLDKGLEYFNAHFKRKGMVVFQAHPFRDNMTLMDTQFIDGVEAFNLNPRKISRVPAAIDYAKKNGLKVCGGSDTHLPEDVGSCLMKTKKILKTSADVAQVLDSQDFVLDVFGATILP